ncbi:MAG: flavin reductase family protein [Candidatus Heimdallarchaeota archaeon]
MRSGITKVEYGVNRADWNPNLLVGPVALISTYDENHAPNIAPMSFLSVVSLKPSILMFSGRKKSPTERNILIKKCFGVNIVDSSIGERAYESTRWEGDDRIKKTGFTMTGASKVDAPLIEECRANLECILHGTTQVGSGFVIFGEIVAAHIWEDIINTKDHQKRYELLDPIISLDFGSYSTIGDISKIKP